MELLAETGHLLGVEWGLAIDGALAIAAQAILALQWRPPEHAVKKLSAKQTRQM